jgi:hypothetical protein
MEGPLRSRRAQRLRCGAYLLYRPQPRLLELGSGWEDGDTGGGLGETERADMAFVIGIARRMLVMLPAGGSGDMRFRAEVIAEMYMTGHQRELHDQQHRGEIDETQPGQALVHSDPIVCPQDYSEGRS